MPTKQKHCKGVYTVKFYDTNALLSLLDEAFSEPFMFSDETLKEIENIKTSSRKDEDIKYRARQLSRLLDQNLGKYTIINYNAEMEQDLFIKELDFLSPDNRIISCAASVLSKNPDIIFVSDDLCCKHIARVFFNLPVQCVEHNTEEIYKGYRIIHGNTYLINEQMYDMDLSTWNTNEYLIIENTDDHTSKELRFDGTSFVNLKLPNSNFIKAKNSLQRCALDILTNPQITIAAILGGFGSGKTYLSMKMALYHINEKGEQNKILGIREPRGEGREVGYLPGSLDEKTDKFFLPLMQQLDGGEFELERLKQRGVLESNIPFYMKGTTYDNTIILVDEAEDLDKKQIRLIGTRLGENSKIFLAGDYKQSVINSSKHNALLEMCKAFKGNSKFGCIYLGEDVRSETSKMFAELLE